MSTKKIALMVLLTLSFGISDEISDYNRKQQQEIKQHLNLQNQGIKNYSKEFNNYIAKTEEEFKRWKTLQNKEFNNYKNKIIREWGYFHMPSNKKWVEYSNDKKSVGTVDFEQGTVSVEVIKINNDTKEKTQSKLKEAVVRILTSRGNSQTIPSESGSNKKGVMKNPILLGLLKNSKGEILQENNANKFADNILNNHTKKIEKLPDGRGEKVTISFSLIPEHLKKRIKPFLPYIYKYCKKYRVDPAHVLATIHTESYFNPLARSHCNAIGLMQLVPKSGGKEAYQFVFNTNEIPSAEFYYNPEINIMLGIAYIHLLKNYTKDIIDKKSLTYCVIAGYNTGLTNVAFAFIGKRSLKPAIVKINTIGNHHKVYTTLLENLPYNETKTYLKNVVKRIEIYK